MIGPSKPRRVETILDHFRCCLERECLGSTELRGTRGVGIMRVRNCMFRVEVVMEVHVLTTALTQLQRKVSFPSSVHVVFCCIR